MFRSVPAERALATASAEIDRLGLVARAVVLGPAASSTMRVTLLRDGAQVAVGAGKGAGVQGVASACFEALERYLMSARDNRRWTADATRLLSATDVAGQSTLELDLVVQRWAAEFPDSVAACASYGGVRYPTFLTDPRYFRWPWRATMSGRTAVCCGTRPAWIPRRASTWRRPSTTASAS